MWFTFSLDHMLPLIKHIQEIWDFHITSVLVAFSRHFAWFSVWGVGEIRRPYLPAGGVVRYLWHVCRCSATPAECAAFPLLSLLPCHDLPPAHRYILSFSAISCPVVGRGFASIRVKEGFFFQGKNFFIFIKCRMLF